MLNIDTDPRTLQHCLQESLQRLTFQTRQSSSFALLGHHTAQLREQGTLLPHNIVTESLSECTPSPGDRLPQQWRQTPARQQQYVPVGIGSRGCSKSTPCDGMTAHNITVRVLHAPQRPWLPRTRPQAWSAPLDRAGSADAAGWHGPARKSSVQ